MRKFLFCVISLLIFTCCDKQQDVEITPQKELSYNMDFENKIGSPSGSQEWGNWYLNIPSLTRTVNNDSTSWNRYKKPAFPSDEDVNDIVVTLSEYYDGINMVNIPEGDYWVKTIYKDEINYYIPDDWHGIAFYAYEKMSSISVYNQEYKMYEKIDSIDALSLIEHLDGYDGVMPQFAYYDELYSENHFEQRTIEYNGVYYVGFDFYADGFIKFGDYTVFLNGRDYLYNDWVIMLIPAKQVGQEKIFDEKRVMCEDLSDSHDFDFNDLIFDVAIVDLDGELKTKITIQAIGTTEPITVEGVHAHELFNLEGVCVNTSGSRNGVKREPKSFYLDKLISDIREIEVTVFYDNKLYFITTKKGRPTKKLCVSTNTKWGYEGYGLWIAYPSFKEYVKDPEVDWEKNVNKDLLFNATY